LNIRQIENFKIFSVFDKPAKSDGEPEVRSDERRVGIVNYE
jgi:hypothetical protein